jgi:hypothetical protein
MIDGQIVQSGCGSQPVIDHRPDNPSLKIKERPARAWGRCLININVLPDSLTISFIFDEVLGRNSALGEVGGILLDFELDFMREWMMGPVCLLSAMQGHLNP